MSNNDSASEPVIRAPRTRSRCGLIGVESEVPNPEVQGAEMEARVRRPIRRGPTGGNSSQPPARERAHHQRRHEREEETEESSDSELEGLESEGEAAGGEEDNRVCREEAGKTVIKMEYYDDVTCPKCLERGLRFLFQNARGLSIHITEKHRLVQLE